MISISQLAKLAGVSKSTVARALNGQAEISPATRQRIVQLAKEHHYAPLVRMTTQAKARQPVIGWVRPGYSSATDNTLGMLLSKVCAQRRHLILNQVTEGRWVRLLAALKELLDFGVEGIVIHSGHLNPLPADLIQRCYEQGVPIVTYDVTAAECPVDWVGMDEGLLGEMAVDYLYQLGHRRIAFLGDLSKGPTFGRPKAVYDALARRGLATDLMIDQEFKDVTHEVEAILLASDPPTAMIGERDLMAILILSIAKRLRINVPAQLSVLGFGDYPFSPHTTPALTTFAQPDDDLARNAVDLLFARIADPTPQQQGRVERVALKPRLVQRASCARPTP
jgi:LacI family transcriptional regulator